MNKKQAIMIIALAFLGGFIGGAISGKMFESKEAHATSVSKTKIIEASEFRVLDDKGNTLGSFGAETGGAVLSIHEKKDKKGNEESVKIDKLGMVAELKTPGHYRYEKVIARYWSLGMIYDEYSKRDLEQKLDWDIDRHMIIIGDGNAKTPGPAIKLSDRNGNNRAVLGVADLQNKKSGATILRPPSSLVLFNENGGVIWEAP